jgi:hypothetical protein
MDECRLEVQFTHMLSMLRLLVQIPLGNSVFAAVLLYLIIKPEVLELSDSNE